MSIVKECDLKTAVRVNGGWVRDKILGLESDDIDLSLDDMYGEDFAKLISEKMNSGEGKEKVSYSVLKANSEKSKHLETATIKLNGQLIDLVNLRSETYTDSSRVPTIERGTPEQDAYRRDLTINSLFYNLNTRVIEDFTGKGLSDLEAKVIRTPQDPLKMMLEDPLRVLRIVRFANRFNFKMSEDFELAA
jgi:tRNA nucleotidyltransferase (CCA-adding enzyme)